MKKTLHIIILLTAMSISACTKMNTDSGQPEAQYPYIFFDAELAHTKGNLFEAETLPKATGTAFGVFGYRGENAIFGGAERMHRKTEGGSFLYDNLVLWTEDTHDFHAFYPYDETIEVGKDAKGAYVKYTQPETLEAMSDFMTASKMGMSYQDGPLVNFTFQHRLFAFDVEIKNSQKYSAEPVGISSATVNLHEIASGACLYSGEAVCSGTTDITSEFGFTGQSLTVGNSLTLNGDNSFLLLPASSLTVSFNIKGTDEFGDFDIEVTPQTITSDFKAGKRYRLTISKLDGEGFTATVSEWADGGEIKFTFK